jgi:NAD(P)-dependent dehydrogenase (short-subunit alcohol dehydrogenase family)
MEIQMSGNHFGHFLLTRELLPALKKAGKGARVVTLSSSGHSWAYLKPTGFLSKTYGFDFDHFNDPAFYDAKWNYGHVRIFFSNHPDQTCQYVFLYGAPTTIE